MPGSLFHAAAALAVALSGAADVPDEAEIVDSRQDFEIVLAELDVITPEDPTDRVVGITTQFLDGEPVLSELFLTEPMLRADMRALEDTSETGTVPFRCQEVILYLINGWHVISGESCAAPTR